MKTSYYPYKSYYVKEYSEIHYRLVDTEQLDTGSTLRGELHREVNYELIPNDPKIKPVILSGNKILEKMVELFGSTSKAIVMARCMLRVV